jgi:hypothetical protein
MKVVRRPPCAVEKLSASMSSGRSWGRKAV